MSDIEDAKRIGRSLPGTQDSDGLGVLVKGKVKGFAWPWMERIAQKKPRIANFEVLAVRTANCDEKDSLIASDPDIYFTEPHYNGYPAVLVRLSAIGADELQELLIDAWRTIAPKGLAAELNARESAGTRPLHDLCGSATIEV